MWLLRKSKKDTWITMEFARSSNESFCVCIVVPDPEKIQELADKLGIKGDRLKLYKDSKIRSSLLVELNKIRKEKGLKGFEVALNIHF